MPKFIVIVPIAGHASCEVEAETEEQAKELAMEQQLTLDEWEALETFATGNICHCPLPWEIEVEPSND